MIKHKAEILEPFLVVSTFWVYLDDPYQSTQTQLKDLYEHNPIKEAILSDIILSFKPTRYICLSTYGFLTSKNCSPLLIEPNSPEVRYIGQFDGSYKAIVTEPCLILSKIFLKGEENVPSLIETTFKDRALEKYSKVKPDIFPYSDPIQQTSSQIRYIQLIPLQEKDFPFVLSVMPDSEFNLPKEYNQDKRRFK